MTQSTLDEYQDSGCIDHTDPETLRRLYWDERLSGLEIADLCGVSDNTIYKWMKKFGIERRNARSAKLNSHRNEPAKLRTREDGYECWSSFPNDNRKSISVHRLLAVSEYGIDEVKGKHVHHKSNIPWDNRPENIELMDPKEHSQHHLAGENSASSKLTREEVLEIKRRLDRTSESDEEIAKDYDVTYGAIGKIRKGQNWTSVI